jgi:hypothetical protein
MATPAQIRAQYYRSNRRSPEAQAIAERLENAPRKSIEESGRISKFNEGRDPFLNTLSDAELALAPGGFSSVGMDPGARRETVRAAVEAEIPDWLPAEVENRLRERQDKMGQRLVGREKEQAEFSRMAGVNAPAMDGEAPVSAATRREREQAGRWTAADEALQKAGITAETYWEEDPMKTGSFIREATTPEGNVISQRIGAEGLSSTTTPSGEASTMAAQRKEAQEKGEAEAIRAGIGKSKIEKKRAAARAERALIKGQETADTFAQWDADKRYKKEGEQLQTSARRRLVSINRALSEDRASVPLDQRRGGRFTGGLSAEEYNNYLDEKAELQGILDTRDTTALGREAEAARVKNIESVKRLGAANLAQAEAQAFGVSAARNQMASFSPYDKVMGDLLSSYLPMALSTFGAGGFGSADNTKDKK